MAIVRPPSSDNIQGTDIDDARVQVCAFAATSAGAKVYGGRGRICGWSLLDTRAFALVPPTTGTLLDGYLNGPGNLIVIPGNTAWYGTLRINAMLQVDPSGAKVGGSANISTDGFAVPNAQLLLNVSLQAGAVGATALAPDRDRGQATWGPGWIIANTAGSSNVVTAHGVTKVDFEADGVTMAYPASANTVVEFYDGTDATGNLLGVRSFLAGTSDAVNLGYDGPVFDSGVFVRVVAGTVRGVVFVRE